MLVVKQQAPPPPRPDTAFLRRVYGHIKDCPDPKVQRIAREVESRLQKTSN